jgi:predicted SnoaL-like aldol condensation-catalyzing enzyme
LSPAAPVGRAVRDGADVVQQFYAAVNETIATGNPADLQRVVAPHFVEENPLPGVEPGRTGLEDYLIALHDFVPGLRLVAEVMVVSAGQVVTRVDVQDDQISTVLPAALGERAAVWSAVEIFRVAGGVVVGRWGITDGLMLARPLAEVSLNLPLPSPRVVALGRVTIAPSARWDAPSAGPRLLYMNEGAVIVELAPGAIAGTTPEVDSAAVLRDGNRSDTPQPVMLAAGRAWVAPAETRISMTNVGGAAAQLLMLAFSEPQIPNGAAPVAETPQVGVEVHVLAGDLATVLGVGPVSLSLEQIALASKAGLSLSSAEGPILIAVEMG